MSKRDELITRYSRDLTEKFNVNVDNELLTNITVSLGPSIYNSDAATVSSSDESEVQRVKDNFLIRKLSLTDQSDMDKALDEVFYTYGKTNRNKYRAVIYYMLTKHFNKESVFMK